MNITKESEELGTPVTLEETTANHDAWWDSLTDKDKEKLFQEQYNRTLTGKQLGQFHIDFDLEDADGNECSGIYAYKSIFLGKKCYIDLLRGIGGSGEVVEGFHIRMKGVPNSTIKHTATMLYNDELDKNLYSLYDKLYHNHSIDFDLLEYKDGVSNRCNFKFEKNNTIRSMKVFTRTLSFGGEVMVF